MLDAAAVLSPKVPPILVFGWGNWSRGDDGLGVLFVHHLAERLCGRFGDSILDRVEFLDDFQLQIEHALDLVGRQHVLFADASVACAAPFSVSKVLSERDASYTSHAMSPAALLQVYEDVQGAEPPPCLQLAIRGERFELGETPSEAALDHLAQAVDWAAAWIGERVGIMSLSHA